MLGKMMAESGGADRIAYTLIKLFGEKNVHWAMVVIGFVIGLPVFFEVGFVLLIPIAFSVARRTQTSLVLVGLPMVAGLSVVHGLMPPHPAAMLAVTIFNADVGRTIFTRLLIGIPRRRLPVRCMQSSSRRGLRWMRRIRWRRNLSITLRRAACRASGLRWRRFCCRSR